MGRRSRLVATGLLAVLLLTTAAKCGSNPPPPPPPPTSSGQARGCPTADQAPAKVNGKLAILAGSELKDLVEVKDGSGRTVVDHIRDDTGISIDFTYVGTLDAVQQVVKGKASEHYDAIWLPSNQYLDLYLKESPRPGLLGNPTAIMRSPVVLGVRQPAAAALEGHHTWVDFAQLATRGTVGFAMTNPAASNSGFSALVAVATALRGTSGPIGVADVTAVTGPLKDLFSAQRLTAGSSGWLKDAYVRRARDGTPIDAMINYESVLLSVNRGAQPGDRLTLIYPAEGVITADYPLTPIVTRGDDARRRSDALVSYLCRKATQSMLMTMTFRRPSRADVELPAEFGPASKELNPPAQLAVADGLIHAFGNTIRRPARTIYVLDLSGSMRVNRDALDPTKLDQPNPPRITRIDALRHALLSLTGADTSLTAQFAVFHEREQVILLTFSDQPNPPQRFQVPAEGPEGELRKIGAAVNAMKADGNTALYDALAQAYLIAGETTDVDRYTTIALFTDGERTAGKTLDEFRAFYDQLPLARRQVPVFSVLFGEGNTVELTALSDDITGGQFFDGRGEHTLAEVFQDIRGYQ